MTDPGIGYTLATGRLFCDISAFHAYAEKLIGRPILTHEFADKALWAEMREKFEVADGTASIPRKGDQNRRG